MAGRLFQILLWLNVEQAHEVDVSLNIFFNEIVEAMNFSCLDIIKFYSMLKSNIPAK